MECSTSRNGDSRIQRPVFAHDGADCHGAASYLMEPYLDSEGRRAYKQGLVAILKDVLGIEGGFEDKGRMERIKRGIEERSYISTTSRWRRTRNKYGMTPKLGYDFRFPCRDVVCSGETLEPILRPGGIPALPRP